jgi:hypothetical protein
MTAVVIKANNYNRVVVSQYNNIRAIFFGFITFSNTFFLLTYFSKISEM